MKAKTLPQALAALKRARKTVRGHFEIIKRMRESLDQAQSDTQKIMTISDLVYNYRKQMGDRKIVSAIIQLLDGEEYVVPKPKV